MEIEIKSRRDGSILFQGQFGNLKLALEAAVSGCADLTCADLRGADLKGAYLTSEDLRGADLKGADLTGAYLTVYDSMFPA